LQRARSCVASARHGIFALVDDYEHIEETRLLAILHEWIALACNG
jgi:hypothetical protein